MRRALAALVAAVTLVVTLAQPVQLADASVSAGQRVPAKVAADKPCDWQHEYDTTIAQLGEQPRDWIRMSGGMMTNYLGRADLDNGYAVVNPATPCRRVASVIYHEWIHLQQGRAHGGLDAALDRYGDRLEIVADCGALLLGSTHTPYRDKTGGCTAADLDDARALIAHR